MPYGDFDVTFGLQGDPVATEQMRYLEGFGLPAQQTVSTSATQYLHGDLIRSTVMTTDDSGSSVASVAYTAFGEVIGSAPDTRYQYAGGWGYETAGFGDDPGLLVLNGAEGTAPITLQHVGFRWYDPAIGRFIQRDPIGIWGGINLYGYCAADPLARIDPAGLFHPNDDWGWLPGHHLSPGEKNAVSRGARGALITYGELALGVGAGGATRRVLASSCVRRWFRADIGRRAHQIPGLRQLGKLNHINIGRRHIIVDPRYWWRRIKKLMRDVIY